MVTRSRLTPLYFGPLGRRLFGCYHAPAEAAGPPRDTGIVLCPAQGHEYIQFHRAFQKLAAQLSELGFPVLRFDVSGCGDSEGDHALWSLDAWRSDIDTAIDELKQQSRVQRVAVVGLRLGATLAAQVAATRDDVDSLALWDPVVNGADYVKELRAQHARMLGYAHVLPAPASAATGAGTGAGDAALGADEEILGFAFPAALAAELQALDLAGGSGPDAVLADFPAKRILLVESNDAVDQRPLRDHLSSLGGNLDHQSFSNPHLWAWVEDFGKVHVPRQLLDAVCAWAVAGGKA